MAELRDQADKDFLRVLEIEINKGFEISLCLEINKWRNKVNKRMNAGVCWMQI